MIRTVRRYLSVCVRREHLRRTGTITLIVGTWLNAFNHGGALLQLQFGAELWIKLFTNYLTPFVVANWGLVSRQTDDGATEESGANG
jgi:hypothetical protein